MVPVPLLDLFCIGIVIVPVPLADLLCIGIVMVPVPLLERFSMVLLRRIAARTRETKCKVRLLTGRPRFSIEAVPVESEGWGAVEL
jgi:hypothetical protein